MYRSAAHGIRVLPAASHVVRGRLESAFGLSDDRVPVTGEPRVDVLSQGTAETRRSHARQAISAATGHVETTTRLVLYAPTWRDGAPDPAVPTAEEWRALVDVLARHRAVLLVRSHPLGAGEYAPPFADGARARARQRPRHRCHAASARTGRARDRLLVARVRRVARASAGALPRARCRGLCAHARVLRGVPRRRRLRLGDDVDRGRRAARRAARR